MTAPGVMTAYDQEVSLEDSPASALPRPSGQGRGMDDHSHGFGASSMAPPSGQAVITGSSPHRKGFGPRHERRGLERAGLGAKG